MRYNYTGPAYSARGRACVAAAATVFFPDAEYGPPVRNLPATCPVWRKRKTTNKTKTYVLDHGLGQGLPYLCQQVHGELVQRVDRVLCVNLGDPLVVHHDVVAVADDARRHLLLQHTQPGRELGRVDGRKEQVDAVEKVLIVVLRCEDRLVWFPNKQTKKKKRSLGLLLPAPFVVVPGRAGTARAWPRRRSSRRGSAG